MKLKAFLKSAVPHSCRAAKNIPMGASGFYITGGRSQAGYSGDPLPAQGWGERKKRSYRAAAGKA